MTMRTAKKYAVPAIGILGFVLIYYSAALSDGGVDFMKCLAIAFVGIVMLVASISAGCAVSFDYDFDDADEEDW